jgi:long-chain acyl-CoA synthetase
MESLKAWVVLQPGQSASEKDIVEHASKSLAPYEVPRRIAFVNEIPKSAIGKTLRRELIRMEMEERSKQKV